MVCEKVPLVAVRINLPLLASIVLPTSADANEPEPRETAENVNVYSFTSCPAAPTINILVPSVLKVILRGLLSCEATEKLSEKEAVDMSNPVDNAYSYTASPAVPQTNILVPSELKAIPVGTLSCELTSKFCV